VNGVRVTGTIRVDETTQRVTVDWTATGTGTALTLHEEYSRNPDDFTRVLRVQGTLTLDNASFRYDVDVNLDSLGNGKARFNVRAGDGSRHDAYTAELTVASGGRALNGEEVLVRTDGFWTQTRFSVLLDATYRVESGFYTFAASNGYRGQFVLHDDGTGEGLIRNSAGGEVATLSTDEAGHVVITYSASGWSETLPL
jgi:hypothetical protein